MAPPRNVGSVPVSAALNAANEIYHILTVSATLLQKREQLPQVSAIGFVYMELRGKLTGFAFARDMVLYKICNVRLSSGDGHKPTSVEYFGEQFVDVIFRSMIMQE